MALYNGSTDAEDNHDAQALGLSLDEYQTWRNSSNSIKLAVLSVCRDAASFTDAFYREVRKLRVVTSVCIPRNIIEKIRAHEDKK